MEFVISAYLIVWIFVFLYMLCLAAKQSKLARDVEELKQAIAEGKRQ